MNDLIRNGKTRTILISICILYVSLHGIYYYQSVLPEIDQPKLIRQIIRFLLTTGLLLLVYKGKRWAKIVTVILFALGALIGLTGLLTMESGPFVYKLPLLVMILVYTVAVYHFGFSKSYQAFFAYQNGMENPSVIVKQPEDTMNIIWRGELVGYLKEAVPDHAYLHGQFVAKTTGNATNFIDLATSLDAQQVMQNPQVGTRVQLKSNDGELPTHALVLSLEDGEIFLRRVMEEEAINWLVKHVN